MNYRWIPAANRAFRYSVFAAGMLLAAGASGATYRSGSEILASAQPSDWRNLDPAHTLYMELPSGRVIIELAPAFAPNTVANIEALVQEHYFDGLAILRVQDNWVVQWGDPDDKRKSAHSDAVVKAEFSAKISDKLTFKALPDTDGWAPQSGFVNSLPVGRDAKAGQMWLTHCYGSIGVGRDNSPDSGNGTSLYAVLGPARILDRDITVVGRVLQGMELLSVLPRGPAPMGFYPKPEQYVSIASIKLASDVPVAERTALQVLRSDTPLFAELVEARRNRHDEWTRRQAGYIDVCSINVPVRIVPAAPQ
jgi:peptidylprolyl isomerase